MTIKEDKLLLRKEIKNSDRLETNAQEKARTTAKDVRKGYSSKSRKASSQRRRRRGNERASSAKKRQEGKRRPVFKLSDHLSEEIIEKLRVKKEEIENGSGEANRN